MDSCRSAPKIESMPLLTELGWPVFTRTHIAATEDGRTPAGYPNTSLQTMTDATTPTRSAVNPASKA